ncbi:hypothetical protein RQP46_002798 [Phenoliferia psychrophenolica]
MSARSSSLSLPTVGQDLEVDVNGHPAWQVAAVLKYGSSNLLGKRPRYVKDAKEERPHSTDILDMLDDLEARKAWVTAGNVLPAVFEIADMSTLRPLFNHYFTFMHSHFPILNPELHTLAFVASRSQVLLTVICAIASKTVDPGGDLSDRLKVLATWLCFNVIGSGCKSVEIVQAALMLTCWPLAATCKTSEDNTWALTSMAVCMAREINLRQSCIKKNETNTVLTVEEENNVVAWLYCNTRYSSDHLHAALHILVQLFSGVHVRKRDEDLRIMNLTS